MFKLAHISDVHLGPLPDVSYRDLASKRITGYINWQRNRKRNLHDGIVDAITADIKRKEADHIAVTGDLVNLALDGEIEIAKQWLMEVGNPDDLTLVPGNHDAYVPGALDKVCKSWGPWMTGDGSNQPMDRAAFPFLRVRGPVALLGVSSARSSAPFMASGFFQSEQAKRLGKMLDETRERGLFRVVLIHHPPVRDAAPSHKRLFGIARFQKLIRNHGCELVLHGHTHLPTTYRIPGKDGPVPVVGVAATGQGPGGSKPAAQYNMFEIDGEAGAWKTTLIRRGLSGTAALGITQCERVELIKPEKKAA